MFTACPIGDTLAGPCHDVRTLKISQHVVILRAGVSPPMAEMWHHRVRSTPDAEAMTYRDKSGAWHSMTLSE